MHPVKTEKMIIMKTLTAVTFIRIIVNDKVNELRALTSNEICPPLEENL